MSKDNFDNDHDDCLEEAILTDCPKCQREYDEIDQEYYICSFCGWSVTDKKYYKSSITKESWEL